MTTNRYRPLAVVFDMDGTLLDSERIARDTFVESMHAAGRDADLAFYARLIGIRAEQSRALLAEHLGEGFPVDAFHADWSRRYHDAAIARPVPLKAGARGLLDWLAARRLPLALATSTRRQTTARKLAQAGIDACFAVTVCGDEVRHGKPHPEIYLTACVQLGVAPASALAVEDSDPGVLAAHAAGLAVVQVPDLHQPSAAVRALGHDMLPSLVAVHARLAAAWG